MKFNMVIKVCIFLIILVLIVIYFVKVHITKIRSKIILDKIDEALDDISIYLNDKKELILKTKDLVNDDYKENFDEIDFDNFDDRGLDKILNEINSKFQDELIDDEKLLKNSEVKKLNEDIRDNDSSLEASKKYYNDSVKKYNDLRDSSHITKLFCHFKDFDLWEVKETKDSD